MPYGIRALIKIIEPTTHSIGFSYGDFKFAKYGVCVWQYDIAKLQGDEVFEGEVEWINVRKFCTEPKMVNPSGLRVWLRPGVSGVVKLIPEPLPQIPTEVVNNTVTSIITGAGLPFLVP